MSPTSYQTAPPREIIIATTLPSVKPRWREITLLKDDVQLVLPISRIKCLNDDPDGTLPKQAGKRYIACGDLSVCR
jgi:hypothetical protein